MAAHSTSTTGRPLDPLLTRVFDSISNQIAGGRRRNPNDLLPGAADPREGSVPDAFLPEVSFYDWLDPTVWAGANPDDVDSMDLSTVTTPSGPGVEGDGLDWFRVGEAPNNYTNRHNPLYAARRDFAIAVAPRIEEMFGVSAQGSAGYMRLPFPSDAEEGGRSPNSDHYSGGALDFYGTDTELTGLRNWLVAQPWVAFVRWQSESHTDHLHVSVDVGWVAQNWFGKTELPDLNAAPAPQEAPSEPEEPKLLSRLTRRAK